MLYITNSTLLPEVVYKPLHTAVFIKAVRYICIETFVHKTFELYGHMYCYYIVLPEAIFVVYWKTTLFTSIFLSGDLPAMNICLRAKFQVRWCYGFVSTSLQQD